MQGTTALGAHANELAFEAYGVKLSVVVDDPALIDAVIATLPPGWTRLDAETAELPRFSLSSLDGMAYELARNETPIGQPVELELAVALLDSQLRMEIARHAPGWAFIHAGCVALGNRALVLPGRSFAGKTTLVQALIAQGATYLSDEYAPLDDDGRVHPYARRLSIRPRDADRASGQIRTTETAASELGAQIGEKAIEVGLIAALTYVPDAPWDPTPLTPSQGALALLSHSVTVRDQPSRALAATRSAARGADCLEGRRGEADEVARILLDRLEQA